MAMRLLSLGLLLLCMTELSFAEKFENDFYKFLLNERQEIPKKVQMQVNKFEYIFISGFMNEGAADYFAENIAILQKIGVPLDAISVLHPSSQNSAIDNLKFIQQNISKKSKKKRVLIGHSKGATETLLFAMKNLTFVQENVQAIFLIQGAFLGSPIADYVLGGGHPIDEQLPVECQIGMNELASLGQDLAEIAYNGLYSLTTEEAKEVWPTDPNEILAIKKILDKKVSYIRSFTEDSHASPALKVSECYLHTYYGENDGAVLLEQQYLPLTGQVIGTLWGLDHSDFVLPWPISSKIPSYRHAFTKALLTNLADSI